MTLNTIFFFVFYNITTSQFCHTFHHHHTFTVRLSNQFLAFSVRSCSSLISPLNWWMLHCWSMCCIVWTCPHSHISDSLKFHRCNKKAQHPWPVRNLFSRNQVRRGRSIPLTATVGSMTRLFWCTDTTVPPLLPSFFQFVEVFRFSEEAPEWFSRW